MAGETTTPNIGLQVPGFNQANWQVPINFDLNLLDLIFGGEVTVPALTVTELTVTDFVLPNFVALLAASFVAEPPAGAVPGTVYTMSFIPGVMLAVFKNGLFQAPAVDYAVAGNQITFASTTTMGDSIYALYFH